MEGSSGFFSFNDETGLSGRYSVLPNGELLIRNAMISDGFKSYRCLTKHILSGDIQLSSTSGRLIITDPQGTQPPRMSDTRSTINVRQGTSAELTCVAQAYPLPNYNSRQNKKFCPPLDFRTLTYPFNFQNRTKIYKQERAKENRTK
ncbi:down syndrome cell adhesion molecule protein Dscam2-like [Caerostris darwini]|uniref:Down syndrome cell adhesion molecule protein Dscam2-like n=1 Tax=Caerostris darwini TaxID=1538125 RepID=A0AAV4QM66_9ARAC|nr:down syndrome cell adhesion molecule protein Dscam2-like [Caerostris darwini]